MKPDPLTPPDCDLRDFSWMPLDVIRLRDSDLTVLLNGDAFRAAVLLWCASWHQIPAASLPNDERVMAKLAGYGRDVESWAKVRDDALHGFIECSDGRLYHPVVAEKALEADSQRKKQKERTQKATEARRSGKRAGEPDDNRNAERNGNRDDNKIGNRHGSRNGVQQTRPDKDIERDKKSKTTTIESVERESSVMSAVPPPSAPETLSPKVSASPSRKGLAALGSPLPDKWVPDEQLCAKVTADFDMTEEDLQREVPAFHAFNVSQGAYSQEWNGTFYLFCKRWAEHKAKQPAPRIELQRMPGSGERFVPTEADWDRELGFYAKTGRWSQGMGPDPMSPACKAPRHLYEKHGIDLETGERRIPPKAKTIVEEKGVVA